MEKELRGFDLQVDHLKTRLIGLINESNLPISIVYYVLKDLFSEAEILLNQTIEQQYQQFCEQANKELDKQLKENISEEEGEE